MAVALKAAFLVEVADRSRATGMAVAFVHTHLAASGCPHPSTVDDAGEIDLADYLVRRGAPVPHLALVIGPEGCRARRLDGGAEVEVWEVGEDPPLRLPQPGGAAEERDDRQVRALGEPWKRLMPRLHVAVIGAGGTGSLACQQPAHLGASGSR